MSDYFPIKDPVLIFAIVAGLILLSPILLGRWRLPGMIGLLLAGAILGPNALGILARDQSFVLFGTVGLLYIMFMAALEIDLAVFKRYRVHSVVFGLVTFALPQGLGYLVARYLLGFDLLPAILLASLFASHTLLAYPIASRLGIAKSQAVTTAVGGTILTDTFALLVLAVVAGSTRGEMTEAFWYRLGISMSIYVIAILFGLPSLARWFFRRIAQDGVSEFVFVLAVVFGCASLSHAAGVEPIVGAFLAGLALNRLIPHNSTLMSRIQFTGEAVFVPFFLLSVGMLLDVRVFAGGLRSWTIAIGMLVCVTGTKWLAAEAMRPLLRYNREEARVIFGLTVAQAAATLAATMVGYEIGLFDDSVVNGAILMIIGTCILAPLVTDKYGRPLAEAKDGLSDETLGPPQRVLVALAKPSAAHPLIDLAQLIRDPAQGQPVYPLTVVEEGQRATDEVAQVEKMLSKAVLQLSAADVPASPLTRIDLNVPSGILRARRELRGTEIIVGWAGRTSTTEFFFGSMIEKLLADPHYTLVVSRLVDPLNTCQRILFAVPPNADQERSFPQAARLIKRFAHQLGAKLLVLCVKSHDSRVKERIQSARPAAEFSLRALENWSGLTQALADLAGDADLIVLCGMRGGTRTWRMSPSDLPDKLARRFPAIGLLAVYPAEPQDDASAALGTPPLEAREEIKLQLDHVVMNLSGQSLKSAVLSLLCHVPGMNGDGSAAPLVHKLVDDAQELVPGVVLVHAETELARGPAVVFGVSKEGVPWSADHEPAHVFVLLVDPPGRDATRHLQNLGAVARMFHSADVIEQVRVATDEHELRTLLSQASA
jgi:Kef-type K+ transport system membrane component KefB/nucleotide-binding universal stress UspA family protein